LPTKALLLNSKEKTGSDEKFGLETELDDTQTKILTFK